MEHQESFIKAVDDKEGIVPGKLQEAELDEPFGLEDAMYEEWRDEISNRRKE